ncbi:MAG: endonuclease/exonuclease/phosphatase family protein [Bacteroidota bacterium]
MIKYIFATVIAVLVLLTACNDDPGGPVIIDNTDDSPIKVSFDISDASIEEGNPPITVTLSFSRKLEGDLDIFLSYTSDNGQEGEDFNITPSPEGNEFTVPVQEGAESVSFQVESVVDDDEDIELLVFNVEGFSEENLQKGEFSSYRLRILDENPIDPAFQNCLTLNSAETLEVVTWNIERFPMTSNSVSTVVDIISNMDVDIIAVQEISEPSAFTQVANSLEGWGGAFFNVNGGIELGYFYKTSEISSFGNLEILFPNQRSPFPREPVVVEVTHVNGLTVKLVNIHLKCCNDGTTRRAVASEIMKDYFDENEANSNLIVLGDFNDDLDAGTPFQNFIDDADNYEFADMDIATGPSQNWSFPSFPSHIDHILISNELFDNHVSSATIRLSGCVSGYSRDVSDHRPVMAVFSAESN